MAAVAAEAAVASPPVGAAAATGRYDDDGGQQDDGAAVHLNAPRPAQGRCVMTSIFEPNAYAPIFDVLAAAGVACKRGYITDNERHLLFDLVAKSVAQVLPVAQECAVQRLRREAAV